MICIFSGHKSQFKPDIGITIETILIVFIFSSESRADKKSVASEHLHLQPENLPNNWCSLQTGQEEDLLQPGHPHHLHLPHAVPLLPSYHSDMPISGWVSICLHLLTCLYRLATSTQSIILDYDITIRNLKKKDQVFDAGALGNFSLAGFEMVKT